MFFLFYMIATTTIASWFAAHCSNNKAFIPIFWA